MIPILFGVVYISTILVLYIVWLSAGPSYATSFPSLSEIGYSYPGIAISGFSISGALLILTSILFFAIGIINRRIESFWFIFALLFGIFAGLNIIFLSIFDVVSFYNFQKVLTFLFFINSYLLTVSYSNGVMLGF